MFTAEKKHGNKKGISRIINQWTFKNCFLLNMFLMRKIFKAPTRKAFKNILNSCKEGLVCCMILPTSGWIFHSFIQYCTWALLSLFISYECYINCWYIFLFLSEYSPLSSSWSSTSTLVNKHASLIQLRMFSSPQDVHLCGPNRPLSRSGETISLCLAYLGDTLGSQASQERNFKLDPKQT